MKNHEIDYKIFGEEMQFVEIELDPHETVVAESGAFMYMRDGIEMHTIFGDGSQQSESSGVFGKLLSAGKRIITGESLFMTAFTHVGQGKSQVAFASPYPGKIIPLDLSNYQGKIVCQKDAFLCAAKGVSIGIEFQRKLGTGLFGGEGFIMQKIEGDGMAFLHAGGHIVEREVTQGQVIKIDTGCIVAYTSGIHFEIEMIKGLKNKIFGGEGFFYARISGQGKVWLQTLPISRLAARIISYAPQTGGSKEEGSLLGGALLGGIGSMLGGEE
ncbi:MAG: TIGR00266 family protein [Chitinophagales bacterium]|nr:TIGR00266 family protein [Chitinophagales bacterium]